MTTLFLHDERTLWHGGGQYAGLFPVGDLVQPLVGGLPENPETKRRLVNLMRVTGLMDELAERSAPPLTHEDLLRVHPASYLDAFKAKSDDGGGELGMRTPFLPGGYEIAALSAGLVADGLTAVLRGEAGNAYALSRPPGHHCLPDWPNGFCLMANVALAVERARAHGLCHRVAIVDWDVHHGNGTEAIYLSDPDTLAVSLHQENNYPVDTGGFDVRGEGKGEGANLNLPLPPGTGHAGYLAAWDRLVRPALDRFRPDVLVIACGFDAAVVDPLGRMLATAETFDALTRRAMGAAADLCGGRLLLAHEGGYSEAYVPFCGYAAIAALAGSGTAAPDPFAAVFAQRQPGPEMARFVESRIDAMAAALP
ncbi:class II histone deacetylase [Jannaschia sp. Os4]|uniref:class II histone deacetylase n=1 Tax=Jannaschia sp. Os4 TaxID=2807617 RepID=UPI001939CA94|nr:class II histone deacetylase [Jannaschia sp. Os4]MBM2576241.1 class II histone deacetylase [Jannaschia sp. Os4]